MTDLEMNRLVGVLQEAGRLAGSDEITQEHVDKAINAYQIVYTTLFNKPMMQSDDARFQKHPLQPR